MFHKAVKVIIVTEKLIEERIEGVIDSLGGKGYTIVSVGGKGLHHVHSTDSRASVVGEFSNVKIEVILRDRSTAERIAQTVMEEFFGEYPGIVYLEDVEVWREGRF